MNLTSERLAVLGDVTRHQNTRTYEVGKRLQLSRKTVDRVLQKRVAGPDADRAGRAPLVGYTSMNERQVRALHG